MIVDSRSWMVDSRRRLNAAANPARDAATINYQLSIIHYQRRAFSFAEVMFAVIVLGIGFIMIAAIFPVAIQQSKATNDETSGAAIAKAQVAALEDVLTDGTLPAASDVPTLTPMPATPVAGQHVYGQVYS